MNYTIKDIEMMISGSRTIVDVLVQGKYILISLDNGIRFKIRNF